MEEESFGSFGFVSIKKNAVGGFFFGTLFYFCRYYPVGYSYKCNTAYHNENT